MLDQNIGSPMGYSQLNPYTYATPTVGYAGAAAPSGGTTLPILTCILAALILTGMALGLGLGIGAAGLVSSSNLTVITNNSNATAASTSISGNFDVFIYLNVLLFVLYLI